MNEKKHYRDYFLYVQHFIKLSKILDDLKINKPNFYSFCKNFDRKYDNFNIETLETIKKAIDKIIIELYNNI